MVSFCHSQSSFPAPHPRKNLFAPSPSSWSSVVSDSPLYCLNFSFPPSGLRRFLLVQLLPTYHFFLFFPYRLSLSRTHGFCSPPVMSRHLGEGPCYSYSSSRFLFFSVPTQVLHLPRGFPFSSGLPFFFPFAPHYQDKLPFFRNDFTWCSDRGSCSVSPPFVKDSSGYCNIRFCHANIDRLSLFRFFHTCGLR